MLEHEETLFNQALEIQNAQERAAFLKQACDGDSELRQRIERLIRLLPKGEMLEPTLSGDAAVSPAKEVLQQVGDQIGPYKLLEKIGEGGMGSVYMAEQKTPVRRLVALKIVKPGMDSRQVLARFDAERQALALMEHPNIARIVDAGTTKLGHPFFAMELVRGIPLNEFCDQKRQTIRERLGIFLQVCQAIQHAHQKGIIHRDLKPTNVLVTMLDVTAVPKVIDFGIAKAVGSQLTDHTLVTAFAQFVGTPLYMSPEQAEMNQLGVDTRSDVYSLGVMLYELITGTTPFDKEQLKKTNLEELRRMLREEDPPRPSTRISTLDARALSTVSEHRGVDPRRLTTNIRGELDWIVMKALEKDRTRRYQSALEFADDVNRFLRGEPVEAHPPSIVYRLRKIARRHRAVLATTAVLLLVLLLATGFSVRYAMVADRASHDADARRKDADRERGEAEAQRNEAQRLQAETVQQQETIRKNLYVADMRLAAIDLRSEKIAKLHAKLQEHFPTSNAQDYRGWEWYYLLAAAGWSEKTFYAHATSVESVAWSPDGRYIASSGFGGSRIFDASFGRLKRAFAKRIRNRGAAWSPDSRWFAWGGAAPECAIRLCSPLSGDERKLVGHSKTLEGLAWSPDGARLASLAIDSTCCIWDVANNQCLFTLKCDPGHENCVAWHPQGKLIAVCGPHGTSIWNPDDGKCIQDLALVQDCQSLGFTPDGIHLIVVNKFGQCSVVECENWKLVKTFTAHRGSCNSVAVFNETIFATGGTDGVVNVWSLPDCERLIKFSGSELYGRELEVNTVCWDPTGNYLATGYSDNRVKVWKISNHPIFKRFTFAHSPALDLATLTDSSRVQVVFQVADKQVLNLNSMAIESLSMQRSVFDQRYVPRDFDPEILVKLAISESNVPSSNQSALLVLPDEKKPPDGMRVIWSPDRTRVGVTLENAVKQQTHLRVWSTLSNQRICELNIPHGGSEIKWAPDSRRLAVAGRGRYSDGSVARTDSGWVYIFDTDSGEIIHRMQHGNISAVAIAWDSNGQRIASAASDGDVVSWDARTGNRLASGKVNGNTVTSLAWSPDDARIAVARENAQVTIVDSGSCEELLTLDDAQLSLKNLIWCHGGKALMGIDSAGNVLVWSASSAYEYERSEEFRVERLFSIADELIQKTDFAGAQQLLDELINLRPDSIFALFMRTWGVNRRLRNYDALISDYGIMTRIDPENHDNWNNLAQCFIEKNQMSEAISTYTKGLESYPDTEYGLSRFLTLMKRSQLYIELGQFSNAKLDLLAVAEHKLSKVNEKIALALLLLHSNEISEYRALCERVLRETAKSPNLNDVTSTAMMCSLNARALEDFEAAVQLTRSVYEPNELKGELAQNGFYLGAMLFRSGKYIDAIEILTKAVVASPKKQPDTCYFLAMCHFQLDHIHEAHKWLREANDAADMVLSGPENGKWPIRKTLELFRAEATKMIEG